MSGAIAMDESNLLSIINQCIDAQLLVAGTAGQYSLNIMVGLPRDALWAALLQQKDAQLNALEARVSALEETTPPSPPAPVDNLRGMRVEWWLLGGVLVITMLLMQRARKS